MTPTHLLNPLGDPPEEQQPRKPTTFDVLTKLIVPLLTLVAVVIAQLQRQRLFFWVLLGVLLLSLALGFYPSLKALVRERIQDWQDGRAAKRAFPEFKRFLRRFGEFADLPHSRTDTLHAILLETCYRNSTDFEKFRVAAAELFHDPSKQLIGRIERRPANLANLQDGMEELGLLVGLYGRYCLDPIFERLPQELRPLVTDRTKSSLESFRERFVRFLDDYDEYLTRLDESFTRPRVEPHYFPRPKPL